MQSSPEKTSVPQWNPRMDTQVDTSPIYKRVALLMAQRHIEVSDPHKAFLLREFASGFDETMLSQLGDIFVAQGNSANALVCYLDGKVSDQRLRDVVDQVAADTDPGLLFRAYVLLGDKDALAKNAAEYEGEARQEASQMQGQYSTESKQVKLRQLAIQWYTAAGDTANLDRLATDALARASSLKDRAVTMEDGTPRVGWDSMEALCLDLEEAIASSTHNLARTLEVADDLCTTIKNTGATGYLSDHLKIVGSAYVRVGIQEHVDTFEQWLLDEIQQGKSIHDVLIHLYTAQGSEGKGKLVTLGRSCMQKLNLDVGQAVFEAAGEPVPSELWIEAGDRFKKPFQKLSCYLKGGAPDSKILDAANRSWSPDKKLHFGECPLLLQAYTKLKDAERLEALGMHSIHFLDITDARKCFVAAAVIRSQVSVRDSIDAALTPRSNE